MRCPSIISYSADVSCPSPMKTHTVKYAVDYTCVFWVEGGDSSLYVTRETSEVLPRQKHSHYGLLPSWVE